MQVLLDTLPSTPHQSGDLVLHIRNEAIELELCYVRPEYRVYVYRLDVGSADWKPWTVDVGVDAEYAGAAAWKVWHEMASEA